ncbi:MAG: hypothetical protein JKY48_01490 [Flavobacteriales bacterium]|nr:hypothetical protein [Flavobacteriales bacterium]
MIQNYKNSSLCKVLVMMCSVFAISCGNDDSSMETPLTTQNELLNLSSINSQWFLRESPDSIRIEITGGNKPYSILKMPTSSSTASISNNFVTIFPFDETQGVIGNDSLIIIDSDSNSTTHLITIESLRYDYSSIVNLNLNVSGDTSFQTTSLAIRDAYWDAHLNLFFLRANFSSVYFTLWVKNISGIGDYTPHLLEYSPNGGDFPLDYRFVPSDTTQKVTFTRLTGTSSNIDFNITVKDKQNNFNGNTTFIGSFRVVR